MYELNHLKIIEINVHAYYSRIGIIKRNPGSGGIFISHGEEVSTTLLTNQTVS